MQQVIDFLKEVTIDKLLILVGIFFILMSVVGEFKSYFDLKKTARRVSFLTGLFFITIGLGLSTKLSISPQYPNPVTPNPIETLKSSPIPTDIPPASTLKRFSDVPNVPRSAPEKPFRYGGSTTWAPINRDINPEIEEYWTEFHLKYIKPPSGNPGSRKGFQMLLKNQLDFSQSSDPLEPGEHEQAKKQGSVLQEIPVAIDGVAIAVNQKSLISSLTINELKDIYTGKIINWQELNGPNLNITPYSRYEGEGGTVEFFRKRVLDGEPFSNNVNYIPITTDAITKVANDEGGIYYASDPEVVNQCTIKTLPIRNQNNKLVYPYKVPPISFSDCNKTRHNKLNVDAFQNGDYPLTRKLFVIIKQDDPAKAQEGKAYANLLRTSEGQELIVKAGFGKIP